MAISTNGGANGSAQTLEAAFEPSAAKIADFWMAITDIGCGMMRLVEDNAPAMGDHAKTLERDLKRMDELVFGSIEVMDDLFTLVRQDLARRKETHANGVLPVNALDAFLDGATTLPPTTPTVNRAVKTARGGAAIVTPSPKTAHDKPAFMSSVKLFDLLRGRQNRLRDAQPLKPPKLEVKPEASATSTNGKKRLRSSVSSDAQDGVDHDDNKREYNRMPHKAIQDRRPIAVHGVRMRQTQREYAVEFERLDEYVWLASRRAPDAARVLIQAYAKSHQRKRRQTELQETVAAYSKKAAAAAASDDADSDEADNEGIYIVEKIVDHRIRYGKKQYYVKWDGYNTDENTWEPAVKLRAEVRGVVDDYERELAKQAGRKGGEKYAPNGGLAAAVAAAPAKPRGRPSSTASVKSKPAAWGRPSNPSALTKSTHLAAGPTLLQRSGKIPKVQFLLHDHHIDDDESEDSDLLRLAASDGDSDDDESSDEFGLSLRRPFAGKGLSALGAKQRPRKVLSPQID